ncbi:MAG: FAD-linked oxidase C-terminal domain-containing protein [Alphaproteobacteria bacterium]|nr:FAD-linked oxidase C-terminal domain-containing protein [Alphaproteobacteria bacterium]
MTLVTGDMTELQMKLAREIEGDVAFDSFTWGRYATDASAYQMTPIGVVRPKTNDDIKAIFGLAQEAGVPVTARGGGTSQCGQTVNSGLILDCSYHMNKVLDVDPGAQRAVVQPGIVMDDLNRQLKAHDLWFAVDVSTSSRATIGGITGNNSCGGRSLRYGPARDNIHAINAILADGSDLRFEALSDTGTATRSAIFDALLDLGRDHADLIERSFPKLQRRVGGYNIDALTPQAAPQNLAHLLVGSEGTLGFSKEIEIKLWPVLGTRVMGVCHFGSFHRAMQSAQHLVTLNPIAVELIDRTMVGLGREIPMYAKTLDQVVRGDPAALLVVEFAEETLAANQQKLKELNQVMGDLGYDWRNNGDDWGGVVELEDIPTQSALTEVRKGGLNIMMSMKDARKPVSFVEDCAVPLPHLADYTKRLTEVFEKHGTTGTWYAHASVGCLHVRPLLNLRLDKDLKAMRAIAEEAFEMVREYKGSHSGEHGDGLVRSEFHEAMFGSDMVAAFNRVKDLLDPTGLLNPGKIVRPPKFDDKTLLRYNPDYQESALKPALNWSAFPGAAGGFQGAVEMCNNNGACRKLTGGVMCPSYRATRDERDVTRGRANTLRLALSGQLGPDAFTSEEMQETMKFCTSCKACKNECPTGVDMARMKIEVQNARVAKHGPSLQDRLIGHLPRFAPIAARLPWLFNLRNTLPGLAKLLEGSTHFTAKRKLPSWRSDAFQDLEIDEGVNKTGREVVLLVDTFTRYFDPQIARSALAVLQAGGYRVRRPNGEGAQSAPLCCGRTYLSAGMVDQARRRAQHMAQTLAPFIRRKVPIIGLEPSCLLSLRDEFAALLPPKDIEGLAESAFLIEEFLAEEQKAGTLSLPLQPITKKVLLHGHCHQKAFNALTPVQTVLKLIPELEVEVIETSCCGMAGAFGYGVETYDISQKMAEAALLPKVRAADADTVIVADGTSCRHQIADGAQRSAIHAVTLLHQALITAGARP